MERSGEDQRRDDGEKRTHILRATFLLCLRYNCTRVIGLDTVRMQIVSISTGV